MDSSQVLEMLKRGVPVIDIRRQDEWIETGVIEGSRLMTAFDQNGVLTPGFPERFTGLLKKDEKVVDAEFEEVKKKDNKKSAYPLNYQY